MTKTYKLPRYIIILLSPVDGQNLADVIEGIAFPTTVSPNEILTPYTPLSSDATEAAITIGNEDIIKIQLVLRMLTLTAV